MPEERIANPVTNPKALEITIDQRIILAPTAAAITGSERYSVKRRIRRTRNPTKTKRSTPKTIISAELAPIILEENSD